MRSSITAAIILSVCFISSCKTEETGKPLQPIVEKALFDSTSIWYNDFTPSSSELETLPIGVFCSGLEGVSVTEAFLHADFFDNITGAETPDGIADFAGEDFAILVDYANKDYADYVDSSRVDLLRELAVRDALFLLGRSYYILRDDDLATGIKRASKVIISSSDAACRYAGEDIDTLLELSGSDIRYLGLLDCGMDALVERMPHGNDCAVGVLAGSEFYASKDFEDRLRKKSKKSGVNNILQIFSVESSGIEGAISGDMHYFNAKASYPRTDYQGPAVGEGENDIDVKMLDRYNFCHEGNSLLLRREGRHILEAQLNSVGNYARYYFVSLVEKHRRSGSRIPIETVIVGGNVYPYVLDTLRKVAAELYDYKTEGQYIYRNSVSPSIEFLNPIECLVKRCYTSLRSSHLLALRTRKSHLASFITVPDLSDSVVFVGDDGQFTSIFKFGRECGSEHRFVKTVPLSPAYLDSAVFDHIGQLFPESMKLIKKNL